MTRLALLTTAALILIAPVAAHAVAIHVHEKVPVHHEALVGKDVDTGAPVLHEWTTMREVVRIEHRAPPDEDQDGVADSEDGCVFCEPAPVATELSTASAGTSTYAAPSDGGTASAIPSYITECESGGDYGAVGPGGAYGAYQIIPSTSAAYGCDMSSAAGQDACAAEIYAAEGASPWSCG